MNDIINKINLVFIYPGALIRMVLYWKKRSFRELVEDGVEINAMALMWTVVMLFIWNKIIS